MLSDIRPFSVDISCGNKIHYIKCIIIIRIPIYTNVVLDIYVQMEVLEIATVIVTVISAERRNVGQEQTKLSSPIWEEHKGTVEELNIIVIIIKE